MKITLLITNLLISIISFSQSFLLYTSKSDKKLYITHIEENKTIILDSNFNYSIKDYKITGDSLICLTERGENKYFNNVDFYPLIIKKAGFISTSSSNKMLNYTYDNHEIKEKDYNIILCSAGKTKWEIINTKNGRRPACNSNDLDVNRQLNIFAHPVLSNKKDFFIYNQEKWTWLSSFYKTYEVNNNTGQQRKLYNGLDTQIGPTDQYLLFKDLKGRYYIYNRKNAEKKYLDATSAFWLYK